MSDLERINLLTYQTDPNLNRSFVTGLENNEEVLWEHFSAYKYDERQPPHRPPLNTLSFEVPAEFGDRLFSFFRSFRSPDKPVDLYNCHRFGLWMIGSELATSIEALNGGLEVERTMREGKVVSGDLNLGQLGVVGHMGTELAQPFHSLIGLEKQNKVTECIQIAGWGGRLTISSCSDALDRYYSENRPQGVLYTIES